MNHIRITILALLACSCFCGIANAQFDVDDPPINYRATQAKDRIALLARQMGDGTVQLDWDDRRGWLVDLLKRLEVSGNSQTLVFSKNSLQARQISPSNPRAVYFNADVYIGYIPGAENIELSAVDPGLGAVFYTIKQSKIDQPTIQRDQHECMTCHGRGNTKDVPGFLVRSVFPLKSGHPKYSLGTTTTDHKTPIADRFGGWYVTGQHGEMRHRGNSFLKDAGDETLDLDNGANQTALPSSLAAAKLQEYVSRESDIVALMVLEHQTQMHNLITAASYEARRAADYDLRMNRMFERPAEHVSDTTHRRIKSAGDKLLEYLLFAGEAKLTSTISGSGSYANEFSKIGPQDSAGRSLRQFDLKKRMFRYPCSFLIYSESFANLPKPMLDYVEERLVLILLGREEDEAYAQLSAEDRQAILEILTGTIPRIKSRLESMGAGMKRP